MRKLALMVSMLFCITLYGQSHRDSVDVCTYRLTIDMTQMALRNIAGCAELTITSPMAGNSFALDLYKLTTDSVFVDGLKYNFNFNDSLVRIFNPINSNDTIKVTIYYHGKPQKDAKWGGFYIDEKYAYNIGVAMGSYPHNAGRFWFPCIDSFTDRATYEFIITTKPGFTAVCGGLMTNASYGPVNTIWNWSLHEPVPTYLASIAVGPYAKITGTYKGINGDIPWHIYTEVKDTTTVKSTFSKLDQSLKVFEKYFGPYSWERVGYVIVPFNMGAMEHATNIAFPQNAMQTNISNQVLAAHELSHHWFGNLVTCANSAEMWLNEGWATYSEVLFLNDVYGVEYSENQIINNHYGVLLSAAKADNGYFPLNQLPPDITYGSHAYDKGADVVHTLRNYLGDSLFFTGVKYYLNKMRFSHSTSANLCQLLSESTGVNLQPFFENWVYQPGFPHYSIDSFTVTPAGNKYSTCVYVCQKTKARNFIGNKNRVPFTIVDEQLQMKDTTIEFDGKNGKIELTTTTQPLAVLADMNHQIADATTDDTHKIEVTGNIAFANCNFSLNTGQIATEALIQCTYNWIMADTLNEHLDGITLTNLNYWKIDGIMPSGFDATGKFAYQFSNNTNPSINYIAADTDTLVMLYRENAGACWQVIQKGGSARFATGTISVPHIKKGEYAIAWWNGTSTSNIDKNNIKKAEVYPNPSTEHFFINLPAKANGMFTVTDTRGMLVLQKKFMQTEKVNFQLNSTIPTGVYFLNINGDCKLLARIVKI